jgi:hypothetical protein
MGLEDLYAMYDNAQATGVPAGKAGINLVGMANKQRNNRKSGDPIVKKEIDYPDWDAGDRRNPYLGFAMDTHRQGLANHANAANAINSAIKGEMDSRVAQEREKRRMEHEKYLANMRIQMAQKEQEGNIIRSLLNG